MIFSFIKEQRLRDFQVSKVLEEVASIAQLIVFAGGNHQHAHSDAQISILRRGKGVEFVTYGAVSRIERASLVPGSVAYIAPRQPHRAHWTGSGLLSNLYFPEEYLASLAAEMKCAIPLSMPSGRQESLINLIGYLMLDEVLETGGMSPAMVDHARFIIATRLLRLSDVRSRERTSGLLGLNCLPPALELLNSCPEQPVTWWNLAVCATRVFITSRVPSLPLLDAHRSATNANFVWRKLNSYFVTRTCLLRQLVVLSA